MMTAERPLDIPVGGPPTTPLPATYGDCPACGAPGALELVRGHYECKTCGTVDEEEMAEMGDIRRAYLEDKHRGERGKSSDKGPKKERPRFDQSNHRPEQESVFIGHCRSQVTITFVEIRDVRYVLYLTPYQRNVVDQEATSRGWSRARLVGEALGESLPHLGTHDLTPAAVPGEKVVGLELLLTRNEDRYLKSICNPNRRRSQVVRWAISRWLRENTTRQDAVNFLEG